MQRRVERLHRVEVRGLEHVKSAVERGGLLITPNHFAYADPYLLFEASDQIGRPFYYMTAWQVFGTSGLVKQHVLRRHGCFSVDREGADLRAFRQAVEILQDGRHPLVIFPEGEMYHVGDHVTPFRQGPAAIALSASKRASRPVACVPCALKYYYLGDPTPALMRLMEDLERALLWRPRPDLPLERRVYRMAEALLSNKEIEYLGHTRAGPLPQRIDALADEVLRRIEERHGVETAARSPTSATDRNAVPDRVKVLRQRTLEELEGLSSDNLHRRQCEQDLDDLFFAIQLYCYPGDYVAERPSVDRIADTLDKFEEDVLGVPIAKPRAARGAVVSFGEPVMIEPAAKKGAATELTALLERRVQELLDGIAVPSR
jgi:1-acyl-sn-glycerol-3-phosphate acyltransferase